MRQTRETRQDAGGTQPDLFADFNGIPEGADRTDFYQHDQNWSNRMILGDSLQVMASLAEREGLRGKVQCIYFDPPYGIKFNSNFQWSTTSRDVKDGNAAHITREPEQVGVPGHVGNGITIDSPRVTAGADSECGSMSASYAYYLLDEVFGDESAVTEIVVKKKGSQK